MRLSDSVKILPIWGEVIPGNTGEPKKNLMPVDESLPMEDIFKKYPGVWDKSCDELGDMKGNATMVWRQEILDGYAKETMSDVPFLVPYIVPDSDKCVIACPGGAYLFKSMDSEGEDIAAFLNKAGISCFVLWYRTYPYHAPLMYLDFQRAVRYVRHHAVEYHIDPDKIATVGFSAGGNLCGVEALCFGNKPVEYPEYTPDDIDNEKGLPDAVAMCYPAVSLEDDKAVACIAGEDVYRDLPRRQAFAAQYDMRTHLSPDTPPVFLCNCMDDDVLPPMRLAELAGKCREENIDCELHIFPKGGHGFGGCVERPNPFMKPDYSAVSQWKELFIHWLNRVL